MSKKLVVNNWGKPDKDGDVGRQQFAVLCNLWFMLVSEYSQVGGRWKDERYNALKRLACNNLNFIDSDMFQ